jgi:prephenate dehydratase
MPIIALLGPATFSEEAVACLEHHVRIDTVARVYDTEIGKIFARVQSGDVDFGVVPIENTFEGSVHAHMDRLIDASDAGIAICAEWSYAIRFHAIGAPLEGSVPPWHRVQEVYSHPVAFSQCHTFLDAHLAHARCVDVSSTSMGVRAMQAPRADRYGAIALGTQAAAELWQQDIWQHDVHNGDSNATRFWLIGKHGAAFVEHQIFHLPQKTTLVIKPMDDVPGALYQILAPFAWRTLNLTKIESRPTRQQLGAYIFVLDVLASATEVAYALEELRAIGCMVRSLGSYPVFPLLDVRTR